MILDEILEAARDGVSARRRRRSFSAVERAALDAPAPRGFARAIANATGGIGLVAELKPRSPSAGVLREPFDGRAIARAYHDGGAVALSVLTEVAYFGGGYDLLESVSDIGPPCLQKDFVLSEFQILEGRAAGADAVLLIAEALSPDRAQELIAMSLELGLDVLYEAHDLKQVHRVATAAERHPERVLIGVNNRDLRTFDVQLETSLRACRELPAGLLVVAESGIRTAEDVQRLRAVGARGMLVGESLLRAPDIETATRALLAPVEGSSE